MTEPEVSIGMPVRNGARYLPQALDSILGQTFEDLELVVCDNASTDDTEAVVRQYARSDPRVRYFRSDVNRGAVPNYNRAFRLSRGRYFKWAAHDDTLEPRCLERGVAALRDDPGLVLAHSPVRAVDRRGRELRVEEAALGACASARTSERFAAVVLLPHRSVEIFALVRSDALRRTSLQLPYHGCDRALVAELALLGRFHHDPEPLFNNRRHAEQYVRAVPAEERASWALASAPRRVGVPTLTLYRHYCRAIERYVPGAVERARCRRALGRWWFSGWNAARILVEAASFLDPGLHRAAARARRLVEPDAAPPAGDPARREASEPYRAGSPESGLGTVSTFAPPGLSQRGTFP